MPKRFINVEFSGIKTRINVTGMDDLSEVQGAIKAAFSNSLAKFDAPHLLLYTNSNRDQLINTWAFFNSLSQEYFTEGGSCVVLDTLPLPSRQPTQERTVMPMIIKSRNSEDQGKKIFNS